VSAHDLFSISYPGPHEKGVWRKKCNGDGIAADGSDFKPVKAPQKSAWQKSQGSRRATCPPGNRKPPPMRGFLSAPLGSNR
jgi:hypothetical protein